MCKVFGTQLKSMLNDTSLMLLNLEAGRLHALQSCLRAFKRAMGREVLRYVTMYYC